MTSVRWEPFRDNPDGIPETTAFIGDRWVGRIWEISRHRGNKMKYCVDVIDPSMDLTWGIGLKYAHQSEHDTLDQAREVAEAEIAKAYG